MFRILDILYTLKKNNISYIKEGSYMHVFLAGLLRYRTAKLLHYDRYYSTIISDTLEHYNGYKSIYEFNRILWSFLDSNINEAKVIDMTNLTKFIRGDIECDGQL